MLCFDTYRAPKTPPTGPDSPDPAASHTQVNHVTQVHITAKPVPDKRLELIRSDSRAAGVGTSCKQPLHRVAVARIFKWNGD